MLLCLHKKARVRCFKIGVCKNAKTCALHFLTRCQILTHACYCSQIWEKAGGDNVELAEVSAGERKKEPAPQMEDGTMSDWNIDSKVRYFLC